MNRRSATSRQSSSSRSKLYERYDVDINSSSRGDRRGVPSRLVPSATHSHESDDDDDTKKLQWQQQRNIFLLLVVAFLLLVFFRVPSAQSSQAITTVNSETTTSTVIGDDVSSKKANPRQQQQQQDQKDLKHFFEKDKPSIRKRWNPCPNPKKFELERHDHEPRQGDICRAKGGHLAIYECPEGCHASDSAPFCENDGTNKKATIGDRGGPCRVRDPNAPPKYRCDYGSVCIMGVGAPKYQYQFKGEGMYYNHTCDNKCGDGRSGELTPWIVEGGICASDMDCSLSEGADCSYLKFAPVDKSRLGYLDEHHSSWGGSIVQKSDGEYHMYVSEIICKEDDGAGVRCGLNNWRTHSRIAHTTANNIEGPYQRLDVVLHPEHHNPSVHKSLKTGDWHLYTISGPTGPIERMISNNEGKTWGVPSTVSPRQNPGPLLKEDGSTSLFYRADGLDIPYPTCSNEGIAVQHCPSDSEPCHPPNDIPIFGHTGEDPSVFVDHRGIEDF
ncbi:hypothetical protein ACHAXR_007679 [Thalassiosira sp. AJA248-18]